MRRVVYEEIEEEDYRDVFAMKARRPMSRAGSVILEDYDAYEPYEKRG
jgi:hypothetical protein